MQINLTIPAVPVAQPRHRVAKTGVAYLPNESPIHTFKASCRYVWHQEFDKAPLEGPLHLDVMFVLPRPQRLTKKRKPNPRVHHDRKPDLDNLLKALKDALNKLAWHDDSQVCSCHAGKAYASADEQPHVELTVETIDTLESEVEDG